MFHPGEAKKRFLYNFLGLVLWNCKDRMAKVLVAEDDVQLAFMIESWLVKERFTVETVSDGLETSERLKYHQFDVIVLDWELPNRSGFEVLRIYREAGGTAPVIMLTGRASIRDKKSGLDAGADDYLTKPFDMEELAARLRSLLRRSGSSPKAVLTARHVTLDPASGRVTKDGEFVSLVAKEYALLEFLLRHQRQIFSAETLIDRVWNSEAETSPETVRTYIFRLRDKLDTPGQTSLIETVRGMGYRLEP